MTVLGGWVDCVAGCFFMLAGGGGPVMWSSRPGAAFGFALPLRLRTYATIIHAWLSCSRLRNDGMPLGRPRMLVRIGRHRDGLRRGRTSLERGQRNGIGHFRVWRLNAIDALFALARRAYRNHRKYD
jgi:hypothetical protein